jgi:3-phenylpropionate/trans-cinnamate dioxygenase ferredoxin component
MSFKEITKTNDVPAGTMKGFEIDGKSVLVSNIGGQYFAINGKCTHMGGDLAKGILEGNVVTCPRHHAKFDITTGKNMAGPKIGFLKLSAKDETAYPVKVEGTSLMVDVG